MRAEQSKHRGQLIKPVDADLRKAERQTQLLSSNIRSAARGADPARRAARQRLALEGEICGVRLNNGCQRGQP
jgi:hypothetical protein